MSSLENQENQKRPKKQEYAIPAFVDINMESALRLFSYFFSVCVVIGTAMTWSYLLSEGIGGEIVGLLSSPLTLFSMAVYGVFVVLYLLMLLVSIPVMLHLSSSKNMKWNKDKQKFKTRDVWFSVSGVLISLVIAVWLEVGSYFIILLFLSLVLLLTSLVYKSKGGSNVMGKRKRLVNYMKLMLIFLSGGIFLIFLVVVFAAVVSGREIQYEGQILLLVVLSIGYGFCVSTINEPKKLKSYSLLGAFSFILIFFLFGNASINIARHIGLGGFETNMTVLNDHVTELPKEIGKRPALDSKRVSALEKVWVIAALPGKVILASPDHKDVTYTIPPKAILSEWNSQ
jgi:MFS family permease